jgi:hypothetical protein
MNQIAVNKSTSYYATNKYVEFNLEEDFIVSDDNYRVVFENVNTGNADFASFDGSLCTISENGLYCIDVQLLFIRSSGFIESSLVTWLDLGESNRYHCTQAQVPTDPGAGYIARKMTYYRSIKPGQVISCYADYGAEITLDKQRTANPEIKTYFRITKIA